MTDVPDTIKYPETFITSPPAGFDGIFDWSWTDGCFGDSKITPMDFDGVVERKGNFIIFETKNVGVPIPKGQMYTYKSAYDIGCFTILFIEGKESPEKAMAWCQPGFYSGKQNSAHSDVRKESLRSFVANWYAFANAHPRGIVDTTFLNKKVTALSETINETKCHLTKAIEALGGTIEW